MSDDGEHRGPDGEDEELGDHRTGVYELSEEGDDDPEAVLREIMGGGEAKAPAAGGPDVEAAQAEAAAWKDKALRALADLDNLRKRNQKQLLDLRRFGHEGAIKEILPVLDNLDRAIEAAAQKAEPALQGFLEGVQMIRQQFAGALERLGVVGVEAEGQPFDPQFHEAMQEMPSDQVPANTVMYVMEKGYSLHERLLRPARVVVSKGPGAAAPAPAAPPVDPPADAPVEEPADVPVEAATGDDSPEADA